jgi:hypothetical protein
LTDTAPAQPAPEHLDLGVLIAALNGPTPPGRCGEILPDTTACTEPAGHAAEATL